MRTKKLLTLLLLTLLFQQGILYSQNLDLTKKIQVVEKETQKLLGELTVGEFDALVKTTEAYKEVLKSEQSNDVKIIVNKEIILDVEEDNPIEFDIVWFGKKDEVIKKISITAILPIKIDNTNKKSWFREFYRDVAEYALPVVTLVAIIFGLAN